MIDLSKAFTSFLFNMSEIFSGSFCTKNGLIPTPSETDPIIMSFFKSYVKTAHRFLWGAPRFL
jgi:hypothetical protein